METAQLHRETIHLRIRETVSSSATHHPGIHSELTCRPTGMGSFLPLSFRGWASKIGILGRSRIFSGVSITGHMETFPNGIWKKVSSGRLRIRIPSSPGTYRGWQTGVGEYFVNSRPST